MSETKQMWSDPYAEGGISHGERCPERWPEGEMFQCVRKAGHEGDHRFTSATDGRSVTWK